MFATVTVGQGFPPSSFAVGPVTEVTVPRSPRSPVPLTISTRAVELRVVGFEGAAFAVGTAAVMAIPTSTRWWSVANADADGDVLLFVDPGVEYTINAFATNTGWPEPWVSPDGTEFHFSELRLTVLGADVEEGTTFVVSNPAGTLLRVIDGQGNPFPPGTAGVQACGGSGYPECDPQIGSIDTNGDGNVLLVLDPTTQYSINGFAMNTGWPDPWVSPDGTEFHLSQESLTALGADVEDGTTFVVAQPAGTLLRVVDGQGNPFPPGMAGVHACDRSGSREPECIGAMDTDGDGNVLLAPLDPTARWEVYGVAVNTGWPDPTFVMEDGTTYHISAIVIVEVGAELEAGTVFVVAEPGTA